jgi:hypothetical protein
MATPEQQPRKEEVVVAVRVRPLLSNEKDRGEREAWSTDQKLLTHNQEKQHSDVPTFAYDHVFGTTESNEVGDHCFLAWQSKGNIQLVTPDVFWFPAGHLQGCC